MLVANFEVVELVTILKPSFDNARRMQLYYGNYRSNNRFLASELVVQHVDHVRGSNPTEAYLMLHRTRMDVSFANIMQSLYAEAHITKALCIDTENSYSITALTLGRQAQHQVSLTAYRTRSPCAVCSTDGKTRKGCLASFISATD